VGALPLQPQLQSISNINASLAALTESDLEIHGSLEELVLLRLRGRLQEPPRPSAEVGEIHAPGLRLLRQTFREVDRLVDDDGRRPCVLTHLVEDRALRARGDDRLWYALDPDACPPSVAALAFTERLERVDAVGARVLAEAEEDHPVPIRHELILTDALLGFGSLCHLPWEMAQAAASLIGRDEDLARLDDFLASEDGTANVFVLEGEPGIGKTTLWRAGVDRASELGFRVLEARPAAPERELSFAALGDLLAPLHDEIAELPEPQRRALRIALVLEEPTGEPPEQRTIAVALTELLRRIGRDHRVLVAIDDAQWLDAPSASAIEFAIRRLRDAPVRVLATVRGEEASPLSFDDAARVSIGPLSLEELDRFLRDRLGAHLLLPVVRQIHDISGGSPFYGLEVAADVMRSGRRLEPGEQLPIPTHVRELVRPRLATLSRHGRDAALATAALAQPDVDTVRSAIVEGNAAIAEVVAAGVVERNGNDLRFTHPLFAAGIYDASPPSERKAIHSRLATVVTEPEERARHLAEGADGPDATVAAFVEAAAMSVAARGAPAMAARLAKLAVELTPFERRHVLHKRRLDWARYTFAAGDLRHAEVLLEQLVEWCRPGRERAEAMFELGTLRREIAGLDAACTYFERALAELDEGDELELCTRILVELAGTRLGDPTYLTRPDRDPDMSGRALVLAEWLGNPTLLARAIGIHGLSLALEGRPPSREFWQRGLDLEETTGELRHDGPTSLYCYVGFLTGEMKDVVEHSRRVTASMRRRGDPLLANSLLELCESLRISGDWDEAARCADEAYDLVVQTGRDAVVPQCLLARSRMALALGDVDRAREDAENALTHIRALPVELLWRTDMEALAHSLVGQIEHMTGEHANAHARFLVVIESAQKFGKPAQHMLAELIEGDIGSLVALDRLDDAVRQLERLRALADDLAFPSTDAVLARARGLVAAAEGDHAEALRQLELAVRLFDGLRQPWPFQVARSLLALGSVQRRANQKRAARSTLNRALEIFEGLGARIWAERTQAELAQISGRPVQPNGLTPTEARVAELVAAGRSNAEVARELFMSPKTVEWNLSKVYKKLHVRSRSELAAKFAGQPISA
jgi:DNA-binding CsgD family transcriptional regulator